VGQGSRIPGEVLVILDHWLLLDSYPDTDKYQIWWVGGVVTWEPLFYIETLDKKLLNRMRRTPGKKVKFTGARGGMNRRLRDPDNVSVVNVHSLAAPPYIPHQKHGSLCAVNSVANAVFVPPAEYKKLCETDPPLEDVVRSLHQKCALFTGWEGW
jgi:hypothetical protein